MERRRLLPWPAATPMGQNAAYLLATEGIAGLLGLAFWVIVARSFRDADIGVGAALIASGTLLAVLSTAGFNISFVRFLPQAGTNAPRIINTGVTIGAGLAIALGLTFALGAGTWSPVLGFLGREPLLLLLFSLFVVVWTIYLLYDAAFIGLARAKYVALRAAVYNGLKVPLPLVFAASVAAPFAMFLSWGSGLLVANGVALAAFFFRAMPGYRPRLDIDRGVLGSMLRYSFANHATNVLSVLPGLVLPLLIAHVLAPETAAYFYVAWTLAHFLFIIPASIFASVFAEGSRRPPSLKEHGVRGLFLSFSLLVPAILVILLAGGAILSAFKPSFVVASSLLQTLALGSPFLAVNLLYLTLLRIEKRMGPVIGISAFTTIGAVGLGGLFMTAVGLLGVGLGFTISQGFAAGYSVAALWKHPLLAKGA